MLPATIKRILNAHEIDWAITPDGRIVVVAYYTKNGQSDYALIDVTDWTREQLTHWLGY